jgi:two-component system, cell cycle sensor histidine kinase and response regulator CckA
MKITKKEMGKNRSTKGKKPTKPKNKKPSVEIEDVKRLVHLLKVHQIELEHQNQELRITQEELEVSRNKYVNLFDFSPIPYFSLDRDGIIKDVNLIASKMFGIDRNKLVGKRFIAFIPLDEKDVFNLFINNVFIYHVKTSCELKVMSKDKRIFNVRLEGLELEESLQKVYQCQIAVIDLTEFNKVEDSL